MITEMAFCHMILLLVRHAHGAFVWILLDDGLLYHFVHADT